MKKNKQDNSIFDNGSVEEKTDVNTSLLSVESEIDGQEECGKILENHTNAKKGGSGGYKKTYILGNNDFIKFFSIKNNNNDVFDYQQCFYYALLRTIENVKGIKFIGKDIQRFAGKDLLNTRDDSELHSCLCLIAELLFQDHKDNQWKHIKASVLNRLQKIKIKLPQAETILTDFQKVVENNASDLNSDRVLSLLRQIYNSLDNLINGFPQEEQKTINKFVCQLFFLIFFTNKFDIKSRNILVQTYNNNIEFIHIDFDDVLGRKGMFDTFENNKICNLRTEQLFLESLWERISSDELSKYFNEYIEKYTLTEEKLKKIISRTVKNVFRQNYDFDNGEPDDIQPYELKYTCRYSFIQMQEYMQYMSKQLSEKEILLQGGNEQKKIQLMNVLEKNHKVLSNMLKNNTIEICVDESIKRYKTLRNKVLEEKQQKQSNESIDDDVSSSSTPSNNDSVDPNNKSNVNNELNLNDNLNNILNDSKKENNNSHDVSKQEVIINDNTEKNSQMTSCGGILSNIKVFFTQCCSNCETNNSADVNTYSLQVDNTRNIK